MNTTRLRYAVLAAILGGDGITATYAADDATDTLVNIELPSGLVTEVQTALPERQDVNQAYLNTSYNPNITFEDDAHVAVTFLDEGAGYRNSLGYFTYTNDTFTALTFGEIDTDRDGYVRINELKAIDGVGASMIFNNVSEVGGGGNLLPGDTVTLGGASITNVNGTQFDMTGGSTFGEGTQMGFFLLQNAYMGAGRSQNVKGWDVPGLDPIALYTIDYLNPENSTDSTIDNAGAYSRHVAMMNSLSADNDIIMGFEDLIRPGGDNDFNDAVFRIRTDPADAMYAFVPTSETVILLQAAPVRSVGKSTAGIGVVALGILLMFRRRQVLSRLQPTY